MATATEARQVADDELFITREFSAPLALVWRMWESRDHMIRWWGPEGFEVTSIDLDFRPGGAWRVGMASAKWGTSWSSGRFISIDRHRRIVMSFAWENGSGPTTQTVITVDFEARGDRTLQHFHQAPFSSVETRDSHVGGWNSLFNKEAAYAAELARGAAA